MKFIFTVILILLSYFSFSQKEIELKKDKWQQIIQQQDNNKIKINSSVFNNYAVIDPSIIINITIGEKKTIPLKTEKSYPYKIWMSSSTVIDSIIQPLKITGITVWYKNEKNEWVKETKKPIYYIVDELPINIYILYSQFDDLKIKIKWDNIEILKYKK